MPLTPSLRRGLVAALATTGLLLAGCASDNGDDEGDTTEGPTQITYLTSFGASAHDSFVYMADEMGFFEDAGLEVDIQLGGGTGNYFSLLEDEAQFTYTDYTGMLTHIGDGTLEAGDFMALSAVHQETLIAIVYPESSDVESPEDLTGLRIGAFLDSPTDRLLPAYAELSNWEYDEDLIVRTGIEELFGLIPAGEVDVLSTFIIQRGVIEQIAGEPVDVFPFNEVLDDLLGTGIITTSAYAEENPEVAEAFRDAALQGLEATLEDPEGAISVMQERNPAAISEDAVPGYVGQIGIMTPYITARGDDQIGVMDEAHVMRCIGVLESAGMLPSGLTPDAILGDLTLLATS